MPRGNSVCVLMFALVTGTYLAGRIAGLVAFVVGWICFIRRKS